MKLNLNWELIFYSLFLIQMFVAAWLIYRNGQEAGETRRMRNTFRQQWQNSKQSVQLRYQDEELERLFERAGRPLGLNGVRFKLIRDAVLSSQLVIALLEWVVLGGSFPLGKVLLIGLVWVGANTSRGMLVTKLMEFVCEMRNAQKNRDVFILYSLLLNEYAISGERANNLYSILSKFRGYFPLLKAAFDKFLLYYRKSPAAALEAFAREVGTSLGQELADVLLDVDRLDPQEAYEAMQTRYEHFNTLRMEENKRKMKDRGLIGYFITFTPTLSIVANFGYVYYLEYKELMQYLQM
jgi:hypothetical protein